VACLNIQETFIGNKLRDEFKPYGGRGWGVFVKGPASKLTPQITPY